MAIDGINVENWRAKPVKEVINNINIVEEEDSECAQWAQAMAAVANAPDNVTYETAGGSIEAFTAELNEITENGLPVNGEPESGKTEDPDAVKDPEKVEEDKKEGEVDGKDEEGKPPINPNDPANGAENPDKADGTPAEDDTATPPVENAEGAEEGGEEDPNAKQNEEILTDEEEIRKRKVKKGEIPEEE